MSLKYYARAQSKSRPTGSTTIFERQIPERREIVEDLFREGQLAVIAGNYGVGKSPLVQDLALHHAFGQPWCGRRVETRPVVYVDLENPPAVFRSNIERIAKRQNWPLPTSEQLEIFLEHDTPGEPASEQLLAAMQQDQQLQFLEGCLSRRPEAVVVIDPLEIFFRVDKNKGTDVLELYHELRLLLRRFPHAAILMVFNLRKRDRKIKWPDLLAVPRDFLQEVSGTNEILNRGDVRLGIDFHPRDSQMRVINGIRRGEDCHPLIVRPIGIPPDLAGFEAVSATWADLSAALTPTQLGYWIALPVTFGFAEAIADYGVPRTTLYRITKCAQSLGLLTKVEDVWLKL